MKSESWSWQEFQELVFPVITDISNNIINEEEMSEKEEKVQYSQWLKRGRMYIPTDNSITVKNLQPGVYNIRFADNVGIYVFEKDLHLDEIVRLPSPEADKVLEGMKTFWKRKEKFSEYNFNYQRGVLLHGVAGGGKTTIIHQLCDYFINEMRGVVFYISQTSELDLYYKFTGEIFRIIEPGRPVMTIFEDIDGLCSFHENETTLINILNGINQMSNVVYIATTNFISRLNDRIINRPSRFDLRVEVKYPTAEARRVYFRAKLKQDDIDAIGIDRWVNETTDLTMAHLAEIIKCVAILGNDFDESVKRMREMCIIPHESEYNKETTKNIGFHNKRK